MWLDDQHALDQVMDDWLATRELLGLHYDGDVTKEPETPKRKSKAVKKLIEAFETAALRGSDAAEGWDDASEQQRPMRGGLTRSH